MILDLEQTFVVGEDTFVDSFSPTASFGVIFEDNLTTGYFYAVERKNMQILDALHIYDAANISDKHIPSKIQIWWTDDGQIASLLINNYCHAIFDFEKKAGYCRNAFPETNKEWAQIADRQLTDSYIDSLDRR